MTDRFMVRALAAALLLASCRGKSLPDVIWESEHFVYKTRTSEQTACPDVLTGLEEHFNVMQGALGFSWPAGEKITYLKFLDGNDLDENSDCPGGALGCIDYLSVQTPFPFDGHELVHAYLRPTGYPPWMLLEGAAVALSCQLGAYPPPSLSWRTAYASDAAGGELRGAGAWLSGFLLRHRPVGNFLELYRRAGHEISPDAFAALFEEIYGEPLDALWGEMLGQPRPIICPWECSRPAPPLDGTTPVPPAATCGISRVGTIALDAAAEIVATMRGESVFSIAACGDGGQPPQSFLGADDGKPLIRVTLLPPGGYFVLGPGEGGMLTLAALPSQTWVTSSCDSPRSDPPWADLEGTLKFTLPRGTWHIPLAWSPPRPIVVAPYDPGTTAAVCPDCQSTAGACADASMSAPYSATVGGTHILRVVSVPDAESEYSETLLMGR